MNKYMQLALDCATEGYTKGDGGPFGAVIVRDGEVLATAHNRVLVDHDPTAHAEMVAIREACRRLGTHSLEGCEIYATGEPCPMCLSAMIWANIGRCFYANSVKDAEKIGFRDDMIYDFLRGIGKIIELEQIESLECLEMYRDYKRKQGEIY